MPILVFKLDDTDIHLLERQDVIRVKRTDAPSIARAVDEAVALAAETADGTVYCGMATLEALAGPGLAADELVVQLRNVRLYPNGEVCPAFPAEARIQWVAGEQEGLGEAAQDEFVRAPTQHELFDISRLVLRRYHETCAVSGTAIPVGELGSVPTVIRPDPPGGGLSITNFIALWGPLGSAFGAGHFTIGTSYELIINVDRIDPRMAVHLLPGLKLRLPDQEEDWPSQEHLAYHRRFVFRG
ncbi:hypothetical protein [Paradevosia shaoguanensis]|uniref:Uncharacterized protein n=1 Tax=Paradevosia shaoguanensis TaxID=1335043 RepID=A0AA41QQW0_9HYPH|nr:hypothetical protein [Paradevosia shaoguanensis]MCF1744552.1 hypothetical protein [Paradevosia shaoguanensis]MCI0129035.1 hypothetical protein [Paradevosia shaoguanensis]